MKLSVIVPVYRVAATLERCMESIVGQTFTDMEVILVDDGSPDECPRLCDDWAQRDSRIRVIHKRNGGLSDARNAGIDMAKGEWVTFVDSDDFLDKDTYRQVMPLAAKHDIVEFPVFRFYGSSRQSLLRFDENVYSEHADYWLTMQTYQHTYAWNKIYRRSLFDGVRFPVGKVFEDVCTFPQLLKKANSVCTTGHGLYYYCQNDHGITATAKGEDLEVMLNAHVDTMKQWCDDSYYMHVLNIQMDVYELTGHSPILPYRPVDVWSSRLPFNMKAKALALRLLGVKRICKLNKTIHRWKKPHS